LEATRKKTSLAMEADHQLNAMVMQVTESSLLRVRKKPNKIKKPHLVKGGGKILEAGVDK